MEISENNSSDLVDFESESKASRCFQLSKKYIKDRLPILKWFPQYKSSHIFPDAVAGITVGLTAIPQSMAYAGIAGLTPEYGLYSSFISCFVYIFLGSCRQMTIGPTAVIELLTYETCGQDYAECVILTGFYVGLIQLLMGILHLGLVVSVISEPVTIGFVAGAALTISSSQIKSFLGLSGPKGSGFIGYLESAVKNISTIRLGDTVMGLTAVIFLILLKGFKRSISIMSSTTANVVPTYLLSVVVEQQKQLIPNLKDWIKPNMTRNFGKNLSKTLWVLSISRNALVVIISSIVAFLWSDPPPFALTGSVKSGFPPVDFPPFELPFRNSSSSTLSNGTNPDDKLDYWESVQLLGSGPLSIAFISILQNVAIAKAFGSGQSIDANQEMISLGVSHLTASFFSAIPTSGSFTRSAVNEASGVRSPFSGIFTGLLVIFALGFLTPSFYYIPKASLAAVILCAVLPMIEYEALIPMWKVSKLDVIAVLVTFFSALFLGMEYGIVLGVGTCIALYLIRPVRPKIEYKMLLINPLDIESSSTTTTTTDASSSFRIDPQMLSPPAGSLTLLLLKPEEGFSFPSVDFIRTFINEKILQNPSCSFVVLNCSNMIRLDYTAATAIAALAKGLKKNGKTLVFLNCNTDWPHVFRIVGLNPHHCFEELENIYSFIRKGSSNESKSQSETLRLLKEDGVQDGLKSQDQQESE